MTRPLDRRSFLAAAGVTLAGAAGMYAFERSVPGGALTDYATSLWWTLMIITTMGSEYWPKTPDGRLLCLFLAVYAFTVFGYVTATLATFFIGSDARDENAGLRSELALLREELRAARER